MHNISARRRALRQLTITRVLLLAGLGALAALVGALFYQASAAPAPALDQPGALARTFASGALVQMSLFGAVAFGYAYWAIDLLLGQRIGRARWPRWASSALFGLAVAAVFAGLLAWNWALLCGAA